MESFYKELKNKTPFAMKVKELVLGSAGALSMFAANPAMAVDKIMPSGQVSYSTFLQGVNDHVIEKVRVAADGRQAEFLNVDGVRGAVNLFNDPNLFKILQDNGVDLSVMPVDNTGNALFGILNAIAFPLIFFGGLFLLNRS